MHIYLNNIPAKFHPNPIWNDRALGFLKRLPQKEQQQDEQQYDLTIYVTPWRTYEHTTVLSAVMTIKLQTGLK